MRFPRIHPNPRFEDFCTIGVARVERRLRDETRIADLDDQLTDFLRGLLFRAVKLVLEKRGEQDRDEFELCGLRERTTAFEIDRVGRGLTTRQRIENTELGHDGLLFFAGTASRFARGGI